MGTGIDAAKAAGGIHAEVLDNFKDQLLLTLLRRIGTNVNIAIPVSEIDAAGGYVVLMSVTPTEFNFVVQQKQ